jgi:hypothetical protein
MNDTLLIVAGIAFLAGFLLGRLGRRGDRVMRPPPVEVNDHDIEALVRDGELIAAIKAVRQRYRLGLKDAKDVVDGIAARQSRPH